MTNRPPLALLAAAAIAACSGPSGSSGPAAGAGAMPLPAALREASKSQTPIDHVVIVIQENRSFDNLFAHFPGADGASEGRMSDGTIVPLKRVGLTGTDKPTHSHGAFLLAYDGGKLDGFDLIHFNSGIGAPEGRYPYQYVNPTLIRPYWIMAKQYVLADRMFQTQSSASFTAHQDLIAGGTEIAPGQSIVDNPTLTPWGCDSPQGTVTSLLTSDGAYLHSQGPYPCFEYRTLRDLLDAKSVSWKYYAAGLSHGVAGAGGYIWNAFDAIDAVRNGPEWKTNIRMPETKFFTDVSSGSLPAVAWVTPSHWDSDHPSNPTDSGPSWVAQVVNAIGESPYWNSTAIVIVWDDWGGLYDHVRPPQLDYQGLGFRVPMIVVSPYARQGYISHTRYEFGSILKFVENNWHLGSLGTTDVRAKSIGDVFDFTAPPRRFRPIPAEQSRSYFERHAPSSEPVDEE